MASPNILFIMADQLAPHFTGAYGHEVVKTPRLDALAARGMRFDAAYCNSPLCAPSRFSMMAGQLISKIGAYDNASEFAASIPTFAHYLKSLGYSTCLSGKMHFVGPDQMHGFESRVTTDIYPSDFAWTPNWQQADERIDKWYHNMQTVKESGEAMASFQIDYDDEVEFAAKRKLFDYARDGTKPWCMVASFIHPHDPYVARPEWWDLYDDEEIDLPRHPEYATDAFGQRVLEGIEAYSKPLALEEVRRARRAYYANVSYFDSKIGALVQTVEEMGQLDNTIIIVTADHGDMLGERGLWFKMSFFEGSARVPLMISSSSMSSQVINSPVSTIDLCPTICELAGVTMSEVTPWITGESLCGLIQGEKRENPVLMEYAAEASHAPLVCIRKDRWKYIFCSLDPEQLFDLDKDPNELDNLIEKTDYKSITHSFRDTMKATWNLDRFDQDVRESQAKRKVVYEALRKGGYYPWDFQPLKQASERYMRNHLDLNILESSQRYPSDD